MEKSYKEIMPQITTFIFDVDGVLTNGVVTIFPNGEMIRSMNIKDGYALKTAVMAGYNVCIISGGTNENVRKRFKDLGITDIYLGAHNKIEQFNEYVQNLNLNPENILYMGDDIPDFPVMKKVGLPCCPKDAAPEIQDISIYV
jgi:3-deoxy-D-manno-octulosonate 8-phosphate phosphatase (KDO 8-P phosphatase)